MERAVGQRETGQPAEPRPLLADPLRSHEARGPKRPSVELWWGWVKAPP